MGYFFFCSHVLKRKETNTCTKNQILKFANLESSKNHG